jgi:four helix bundle protein
MEIKSFTDLDVYKQCRLLRKNLAETTKSHFPADEKHKLTDQIIRASRRVTACLAEGYGRHYYKENIRFCRMSMGSLEETLEHLITAFDEGYISAEILKTYKLHIDHCIQILNGYIRYLKNAKPLKEEGR